MPRGAPSVGASAAPSRSAKPEREAAGAKLKENTTPPGSQRRSQRPPSDATRLPRANCGVNAVAPPFLVVGGPSCTASSPRGPIPSHFQAELESWKAKAKAAEHEVIELKERLVIVESERGLLHTKLGALEVAKDDLSRRLEEAEAEYKQRSQELASVRSELEVSNCSRDVTNKVLLGITSQALGMKAYEAEMALRATHRDEAFASILKSQADAINEMLQARNYMESEESQEVLYEAVSHLIEKVAGIRSDLQPDTPHSRNLDSFGDDSILQETELHISEAIATCLSQMQHNIKQDVGEHVQEMVAKLDEQEKCILDLRGKLADASSHCYASNVAEIERKLSDCMEELAALTDERNHVAEINESNCLQLQTMMEQLQLKESCIRSMSTELENFLEVGQKLEESKQRCMDLEQQLSCRDSLIAELEEVMEKMEGELMKQESRAAMIQSIDAEDLGLRMSKSASQMKQQSLHRAAMIQRLTAISNDARAFRAKLEIERHQALTDVKDSEHEWQRRNGELEDLIEELKKHIAESDAKLSEARRANDLLEERLQNSNLKLTEFSVQCVMLEDRCADLESKCTDLSGVERDLDTALQDKAAIQARLHEKDVRLDQLDATVVKLGAEISHANRKLEESECAAQTMREQLRSARLELTDAVSHLSESISKCDGLNAELATLRSEREVAEISLKNLHAACASLNLRIEQQDEAAAVRGLRKEYLTGKCAELERQLRDSQTQNFEVTQKSLASSAELGKMCRAWEGMQAQLLQCHGAVKRLPKILNLYETMCKGSEATRKTVDDGQRQLLYLENRSLRADQELLSETLLNMQSEAAALHVAVAAASGSEVLLVKEAARLREECAALRRNVETLQDSATELELRNAELKQKAATDATSYEALIHAANERAASAEATVDALKSRNVQLNNIFAQIECAMNDMTAAYICQESKVASLRSLADSLTRKALEVTSIVKEQEEDFRATEASFRGQLAMAVEQYASSSNDMARARAEIESANAAYREIGEELAQCRAALESESLQCADLHQQLQLAESNRRHVAERLTSVIAERDDLSATLIGLQRQSSSQAKQLSYLEDHEHLLNDDYRSLQGLLQDNFLH